MTNASLFELYVTNSRNVEAVLNYATSIGTEINRMGGDLPGIPCSIEFFGTRENMYKLIGFIAALERE